MTSLAFYKSSIARKPIVVTQTLSEFAAGQKKFVSGKSDVNPTLAAVEFYTTNHCVYEIQKKFSPSETLPEPVSAIVNSYYVSVPEYALCLAYYMMGTCSREARHVGSASSASSWMDYKNQHPSPSVELIKRLRGTSGGEAVEKFYNTCCAEYPDIPVLEYLEVLEEVFAPNMHWKSSYGGKKWQVIVTTLRQFLSGEITPEMFVDTAFTLAHNGGPMFNKGYLFEHWGSTLITVLNAQHVGELPQYVMKNKLDKKMLELMVAAKQWLPAHLFAPPDMKKIEHGLGTKQVAGHKGAVTGAFPVVQLKKPKVVSKKATMPVLSIQDFVKLKSKLVTVLSIVNDNLTKEVRDHE